MISVMSDREIGSKISPSSASASTSADLSFLGIERDSRVSEDPDPELGTSPFRPDPWRTSASENGERRRAEIDGAPGFEAGDMVWGKVKSHPWWPGHIYNDSLASPSVRRMRRDGHVLVAFFGDSSYGWFDPSELIPFEPHYPEKSRQTTLRTFIKAVEEAADEAGRRGALALACCCRSPANFRPTNVPGYVVVDVPGYEPGGIYSVDQIRKARDRFVPSELVGFARQLAAAPARSRVGENGDLHWIRCMAMLRAYRQVVFEEFDETYAQAFGVQPVRPTQDQKMEQQEKFTPRATPLSGPLVIAEALGDQKGVARTVKPPASVASASAKKNKYLLKRREESPAAAPRPRPSLPDVQQAPHGARYLPQRPPAVFTPRPDDDYVLQKRATASSGIAEMKKLEREDQSGILPASAAAGGYPVQRTSQNTNVKLESSLAAASGTVFGQSGVDSKDVSGTNVTGAFDAATPMDFTPSTGKAEDAKAADGAAAKKPKPLKRKPEHAMPGNDASDVRKKKKKKVKEFGVESGHGEAAKKSIMKPYTAVTGQAMRPGADLQRREGNDAGHASGFYVSPALLPAVQLASLNLQLPEVVNDLSALALDPFFGAERNAPSIVRQVFLKFRSLVYQKSLVLPPASEPETAEFHASKLAAGKSVLQRPVASTKPFKRPLNPDDASIAGRKRGPSDRQEEMSAKRVKKLEKVKALAAEKKACVAPKAPETSQRDQRETGTVPSAKPIKIELSASKKQGPLPPPKVPSPTWFVMKFPPRTTLPSVASLKARFARFGPLDLDGTRVYWKSYTCKVLFKHRVDAVSAYSYCKSNDIFGQIKVNYSIREVEAPGQEPSDSQKLQTESLQANEGLQSRSGNGSGANNSTSQLRPVPPPLYQRQQSIQLKSCLKKPTDEVGNSVGGIAKESPRVKFMLGGGGDRKELPPVTFTNSDNNGGGIGGSDGSFPPLLDGLLGKNTKSSVSLVPPPESLTRPTLPNPTPMPEIYRVPPPPLLPRNLDGNQGRRPAEFSESQARPRFDPSERRKVDISREMLSLLMRCNDIVMNVKSTLGYVPYHPL